VTAAARAYEAQ
jgi:hypothetical protein